MVRNALFIVAAAYVASVFMMKSVEGVPVKGDYTTQKTTSDISKLRDNAKLEVYKILQQMISLEHVTVSKYTQNHAINVALYRIEDLTCFTKSATSAPVQSVKL